MAEQGIPLTLLYALTDSKLGLLYFGKRMYNTHACPVVHVRRAGVAVLFTVVGGIVLQGGDGLKIFLAGWMVALRYQGYRIPLIYCSDQLPQGTGLRRNLPHYGPILGPFECLSSGRSYLKHGGRCVIGAAHLR